MILTTTNTENYGREEIHKTLVQMADVAVPANESDVLWRHATFEEAVAYLVATAVVLETDSKELFAIISVYVNCIFRNIVSKSGRAAEFTLGKQCLRLYKLDEQGDLKLDIRLSRIN